MQRLVSAIALCAVAACAHAGDFNERVAKGRKAERTPEGLQYLMAWTQAQDAWSTQLIERCFPDGPRGGPETFRMVGDIQADGTIAHVEVQPVEPRTTCWRDGYAAGKADVPPVRWRKDGMPFFIELELR